ncbi:alpha/beta fold hydrolase [Haloarchaeobius amylolyticus]|uniref:alpha/beta fold hydrolase n=1 Tax=Haloarchaeobius amylolyticus TaxID=1198296 RepID=UPI00226EB0D1|nr:alpha/beta fold hydrolase [Haloarchaeobius amylolyticus]
MTADWTHGQTIVNDVRLHYVEAGDPADPTVVLVHGFPEFWYSWRNQLPALAEAGYHVVAPDMRGYNRSEKPHGVAAYRITELSADVADLCREFDAPVHLVGHDWGGGVVWDVAARTPEVVETLTVMNAPHPARFEEVLRSSADQRKRSWYMLFFQLPWLPERVVTALNCRPIDRMLREGTVTPGAFTEEDVARYREAFQRPGAATSAINYYRSVFREGAKDRIPFVSAATAEADVDVPTLLLWGEQDAALALELTEGLERWVPDLEVVRLPDASHWVQFDAPERVTEELLGFIGAHR